MCEANAQSPRRRDDHVHCRGGIAAHVAVSQERWKNPCGAVQDRARFWGNVNHDVWRQRLEKQSLPGRVCRVSVVIAGNEMPLNLRELPHTLNRSKQCVEARMGSIKDIPRDEDDGCLMIDGKL